MRREVRSSREKKRVPSLSTYRAAAMSEYARVDTSSLESMPHEQLIDTAMQLQTALQGTSGTRAAPLGRIR